MANNRPIYRNEFTWILFGEAVLLGLIFARQHINFAPLTLLRGILGLAYVLFIPGYMFQALIFPAKKNLDGAERAAFSFGFSIALAALLALVLDRLPWGIQLWSIVASEGVLVVVLSVLAIWLRRRRVDNEPATPATEAARFWAAQIWVAQDRTSRALYGVLGVSLVITIGLAGSYLLSPSPSEALTEFYMLGPENLAESYPRQVDVGETLKITLGLANYERGAHTYRVEAWLVDPRSEDEPGQKVAGWPAFQLIPGQKWEYPLTWQMPAEGEDQQVLIYLFLDDRPAPYRTLRLILNVEAAQTK